MTPRWEPRHTALIHRAGIFDVEQLARVHPETGEAHAVCRISSPDWANIVALTADNQVVLVNQYRHGIDAASLEIPGGIGDPGEDALEGAKRELLEETGYGGGQWERLGRVSANPASVRRALYANMSRQTGTQRMGTTDQWVLEKRSRKSLWNIRGESGVARSTMVLLKDALPWGDCRSLEVLPFPWRYCPPPQDCGRTLRSGLHVRKEAGKTHTGIDPIVALKGGRARPYLHLMAMYHPRQALSTIFHFVDATPGAQPKGYSSPPEPSASSTRKPTLAGGQDMWRARLVLSLLEKPLWSAQQLRKAIRRGDQSGAEGVLEEFFRSRPAAPPTPLPEGDRVKSVDKSATVLPPAPIQRRQRARLQNPH